MLSGYRQVKSIVFSGSQYLDTGLAVFNRNTYANRRLVLDFKPAQYSDNNFIYGLATNNTYANVWIDTTPALKIRITSSNAPVIRTMNGVTFERHLFDLDQSNTALTWNWDGESYTYNQSFATNTNSLCLGRRGSDYLRGAVYSFKIYTNGNLARDYVPALREADSVAGFYDLLNDIFYASSGAPFEYEEEIYSVTASVEPAGVPVEIAGVGEYPRGSYAEVMAEARPYGYKINGVYVNGEKVSDVSDYRFEVLGNTHLVFKYDEVTGYGVTASVFPEKARRFVSVAGFGVYERGERATISYSDNAHFEGRGIYLNGELVTTEHAYSFIVNENVELEIRGKYRAIPAPYVLAEEVDTINLSAVNTGIIPDSTTEVYFVGYTGNKDSYVMGARNTNSNTSAGQFNLYVGASSYVGYNSNRVAVDGMTSARAYPTRFDIKGEQIRVNVGNRKNTILDIDASQWEGLQPIYLMAMNNAGAILKTTDTSITFKACRIYKGGELVGDYMPVYNSNDKKGYIYDAVSDGILPFVGSFNSLSVSGEVYVKTQAQGNGYAFVETLNGDVEELRTYSNTSVHLKAVPLDGSVFLHWLDSDGNIVKLGADNAFRISSAGEHILTAVFADVSNENVRGSMQAVAFPFFKTSGADRFFVKYSDCVYMKVLSASIKEDLLQRTKSTIEVESVPSSLFLKMPIVLFDEKGAPLFNGVVEEINENTLTLRELVAVYDFEAVSNPSNAISEFNPTEYLFSYSLGVLVSRYVAWLDDRGVMDNNNMSARYASPYRVSVRGDEWRYLLEGKDNGFMVYYPSVADRSIINVEDLIIKAFESYQVITRPRLGFVPYTETTIFGTGNIVISVLVADPTYYEKLIIADNMQAISNVNITEATQEVNYLLVYNSSGSTLRGEYSITQDGQILSGNDVAKPKALDYANTKGKIVFSDEKIANVTAENLASAMLNHKITLDLDLDASQLKYKDLNLGMPIDFYAGDKLYKSVLTAWEFSLNADDPTIHTIKLTLGKIRTSLTSKLNRK